MPLALLLIFLVVVVIGIPICIAMGFITVTAFTFANGSLMIIPQKMFSGIDNFTYLCIPLFILASEIMTNCGLTRSLVRMCDVFVGHIKGGLAQVNVLGGMLFAGISGSATADATGLGKVEIDIMTTAGFKREYSAAVTAASAIIGPIIPPSNIMIIYAVAAGNVSVSAMFLGGLLPGILLGLMEMALCYIFAVKYHHPVRKRRASLREILHATRKAGPVLGLPVIILGGIVSGVFTATESSAIAVFYAIIVSVVRKRITWKSFYRCCVSTAKTTANVMIIIAIASAMGWAITVLRIPQNMVDFCMQYVSNKLVFLLFINILLLILGCVLDQAPALLIMVPVLLPIAMKYGIDPVHFGILLCFNLTIGLITPPIGMTLFVTANVAQIKLTDMFKRIMPFVFVGILALLAVTYVPALTTFIPNLFHK
jgi:tripartite ATP-independent transporter DctM subunit